MVDLHPDETYREVTVKLWGKGVVQRGLVKGSDIAAPRRFVARRGQFILSRIDARNGALGIVPPELDGAVVTNDFPTFDVDKDRLLPQYLGWMCRAATFVEECQRSSEGTTNRVRLQEDMFLAREVRLPSVLEQRRIVAKIELLDAKLEEARKLRDASSSATHVLSSQGFVSLLLGMKAPAPASEDSVALMRRFKASVRGKAVGSGNNATPGERVYGLDQPTNLPIGWVWSDLGSVATHLVDCVNDTPDFAVDETGFIGLKTTNVRPFRLDLSKKWHMAPEDVAKWNRREPPRQGDIVFTREAPMGFACRLPPAPAFILTQRLMLIRCDESFLHPDYLLFVLNSPIILRQLTSLSRSTPPHLRVQDAPFLRVPVPPIDVQPSVVCSLWKYKNKIDEATQLMRQSTMELDALMHAVLDRSFKGELLTAGHGRL